MIEWTYDKPSEPGLYLAMYGDVETPDNADLIHVMGDGDDPICTIGTDALRLSEIPGSYKFWKVPL